MESGEPAADEASKQTEGGTSLLATDKAGEQTRQANTPSGDDVRPVLESRVKGEPEGGKRAAHV